MSKENLTIENSVYIIWYNKELGFYSFCMDPMNEWSKKEKKLNVQIHKRNDISNTQYDPLASR